MFPDNYLSHSQYLSLKFYDVSYLLATKGNYMNSSLGTLWYWVTNKTSWTIFEILWNIIGGARWILQVVARKTSSSL